MSRKFRKNKEIINLRELDLTSVQAKFEGKKEEIRGIMDTVMELQAEVENYKNIRVDLMSQIEKGAIEFARVSEELDERNRRLEFAENMNFSECYSNEGLNFDLSERIKTLEGQNVELKNQQRHENMKEMKVLESKLEQLENEKKVHK